MFSIRLSMHLNMFVPTLQTFITFKKHLCLTMQVHCVITFILGFSNDIKIMEFEHILSNLTLNNEDSLGMSTPKMKTQHPQILGIFYFDS
jgi:hypothetical protein